MGICTERLIMRPFREGDLNDFYEYAKVPSLGNGAGWKPHESIEESRGILHEKFLNEENLWAIEHGADKKVIGSIGLHPARKRTNPRAKMLGYVLAEPYWGAGLMTEAAMAVIDYGFSHLDVEIISVYHYPFNTRSKRVIEKCGFVYEGTLRRSTEIYDGTVYDDVCYSITKEEYLKLKGK